jgi:hypothetical protein
MDARSDDDAIALRALPGIDNKPSIPEVSASASSAMPRLSDRADIRRNSYREVSVRQNAQAPKLFDALDHHVGRVRPEAPPGVVAIEAVTKSVDAIAAETVTSKSAATLRSERFWRNCQSGLSPNEVLVVAGFDIEFQQDEKSQVKEVTFRLNSK